MPSLTTLSGWLSGWNTLYSNSRIVATTVTAVHILALLVAGGLALAADRMTLRASGDDASRVGEEIRAVHQPVLLSLFMLFVSGLLLAAADVETFLVSPVFWFKMGLVTLLLLNGAGLARTEARYRGAPSPRPDLWNRMRRHAWASVALWVTITVVGTVLVNAA